MCTTRNPPCSDAYIHNPYMLDPDPQYVSLAVIVGLNFVACNAFLAFWK
jgi:hypothetical protein